MIIKKESKVPNSLSTHSIASFVAKIKSASEIPEASNFATREGLPIYVIGDGTNIVPRDYIKALVVILDSKGIEINDNKLKIQAGEKWDDVVKFAVSNNLPGLEALSSIPGRTGSASIQNIGAYGLEFSDILEKVEVFDTERKEFMSLPKKDCQFGYRDSLFKKYPGKFVVVSVTLKLSKKTPEIPKYKDVWEYFSKRQKHTPTSKEIRDAVIEIRKNKLPDHKIIPNAGSYFINPILKESEVAKIKNNFKDMPTFSFGNKIKVSAGWLIENTGLKGAKIGKVEISAKNAMILTNPKRVGFKEIEYAENFIRQKVFDKFGIRLEREPVVIG